MSAVPSPLTGYVRAVLPKRRTAIARPGTVPEAVAVAPPAVARPERLRRYRELCGLPAEGRPEAELPLLWPQTAAFPLTLGLLARRDFPVPLPGLVHVANEVERLRTLPVGGPLGLRVWRGRPFPHPRGTVFPVHTEALADDVVVWRSVAEYLRRGLVAVDTAVDRAVAGSGAAPRALKSASEDSPIQGEFAAAADVGRAYGAVSGDRNPIHLFALTARPFGYRRAIAHGMWTAARAFGALEAAHAAGPAPGPSPMAGSLWARVEFRAPVLLPARLTLAAGPAERDGSEAVQHDAGRLVLAVTDAVTGRSHLRAELRPLPPSSP
ncbi:MaoC/PaaZ C-terminal domain-containing protein [Streptomyces sp. SM14]|uniref:MaoC family dehydratase n=1 Tax=Streptomyces sp. SM14 TaxID=1736045 RepID=UPI0015E186A3|nr:MaoC/PaaZ C-terminal domain-containing protein [Streptomyces sp. SM14]